MAIAWEQLFAARAAGMRSSDIREAFRLAEDRRVISFAGGFPGPDSFPVPELAQLAGGLAGPEVREAYQYTASEGLGALREAIAARMTRAGMPASAEEILITTGSQQALDLLSKVLLDPGDAVITEAPAYAGALNAFGCYQARTEAIPLDDEGMRVDLLQARLEEMASRGEPLPKFAYVVPNYQNPAGVCLSLERRLALVEVTRRFGIPVVEDDAYGELRYEGEPLPPLHRLSPENTVYLGSFSKIFLPGLRVGWIKGPVQLLRRLAVAKQAADLCTPSLSQWLVLRALTDGLVDRQLEKLRTFYRERRDAMLAALERHMPPEVSWNRPSGGFFVWLRLPEGLRAKEMLPRALAEEKVAYVAGSGFFLGSGRDDCIRIAFSQHTPETIEEGVARLGRFLRREIAKRSSFVPTRDGERDSRMPASGAKNGAGSGAPVSAEAAVVQGEWSQRLSG